MRCFATIRVFCWLTAPQNPSAVISNEVITRRHFSLSKQASGGCRDPTNLCGRRVDGQRKRADGRRSRRLASRPKNAATDERRVAVRQIRKSALAPLAAER